MLLVGILYFGAFLPLVASEDTLSTLVQHILQNYSRKFPPLTDRNKTIHVRITPSLTWLREVDAAKQQLTYREWLPILWFDELLRWEPDDFSGIQEIYLPSTEIWTPDIEVLNANEIRYIIPKESTQLSVSHDGLVTLKFLKELTVRCDFHIEKFPFDEQTCNPEYGSWSMQVDVLTIEDIDPTHSLRLITEHPEWKMTKIMEHPKRHRFGYTYMEGHAMLFEKLIYEVKIVRHAIFYVYTLILPAFLITMLCIVGLFTPSSSDGERQEKGVTLSVTALLTDAVLLQIVTNEVPKSQEALPLLGRFILYEMIVTGVGALVSVGITLLHERATTLAWTRPRKRKVTAVPESYRPIVIKQTNQFINTLPIHELALVLDDVRSASRAIKRVLSDREAEIENAGAWTKFFDRLDMVSLIVFVVINLSVFYFSIGTELIVYLKQQ